MTPSQMLRLIVSLSIPSILAQISATVMFFIDASMVGHLGAQASAAIGLVETTGWLMGGLASAANMGFAVQVAHFIGANDFHAARRVLRQALRCCTLWALAITLIALAIAPRLPYWLGGTADLAHDATRYFAIFAACGLFFQLQGLAASMLKCSGNMRVPSMLNILMCVMDVLFNYVFIYILQLGVVGAAVGTGLAMLVTAVLMLWFLLRRSPLALNTWQDTAASATTPSGDEGEDNSSRFTLHASHNTGDARGVITNAFKIGAPMGLQHILMGGAQMVSTIIVAPLGTVAIAAHSLAITVESLCYMPGYGVAEAATTLVGQATGAGQHALTRAFAYRSAAIGIAIMSVMGLLMWLFAPQLMSVMSPVDDIISLGTDVLRIEAWAEPMFAAAIVVNGIFIGAGDTLKPALMNLASMWCVRLTLAAYMAPRYGLRGVWMAMAIELTFRGIIFLLRLAHGRWNKKY